MPTKHIAGIYLLQNIAGYAYSPDTTYYVGQTKDMAMRYDPETRSRCVAFVDEPNRARRLQLEQEAIDFCNAFGLPITNKIGNTKRRKARWHF